MVHIISLGAGVQSSTMALMAAAGEIAPMPTAAIFADTQAEPQSVYRWLDWLETQLPFPVVRVTRGDLTAASLEVRTRRQAEEVCVRCNVPRRFLEGRQRVAHAVRCGASVEYTVGYSRWAKSLIPAFVLGVDGSRGMMMRACTSDYKIVPILKAVRRLGQIKRGQKTVGVVQWIGISTDEAARMKPSREPWMEHRWPLIERGMSRADCLRWMSQRGYPTPPRSACVFCPYHSDKEWVRLRKEEPEEFDRAVQFERDLQAVKASTDNMAGVPYLHSSRVPLDQVVFREDRQLRLWNEECEGICGV